MQIAYFHKIAIFETFPQHFKNVLIFLHSPLTLVLCQTLEFFFFYVRLHRTPYTLLLLIIITAAVCSGVIQKQTIIEYTILYSIHIIVYTRTTAQKEAHFTECSIVSNVKRRRLD